MKKRLVIILGALFLLNIGWSQSLERFSEDKAAFLKELDGFVNASKKKDVKASYEQFEKHVNGGRFTDSQYVKIVDQCNLMLSKKMRANPYFVQYIRVINTMVARGQFMDKFDPWLETVNVYTKDLKRSKLRNFNSYMSFFDDFFNHNALRYSSAKGLQWLVSSQKYDFKFEENSMHIYFPETDLTGLRKSDSIVIKKTVGRFYPLENLWKGEKGEVDWSRTGIKEKVYATFDAYQIEIKKNNYSIGKAILHNPLYFSEPQEGSFSDKIIVNAGENGSYPRFKSFNSKIEIDDIGDNIRYVGGFEMQGKSVIGIGGELNRAKLEFYKKDDKLALTSYSNRFVIRRGEYIASSDAEVSVYMNTEDVIFHPNVDFRFDIETKELELERKGSGNSLTPFNSTYHQVDINAENIFWNIETDEMLIGKTKIKSISGRPKYASFESMNNFNFKKYLSFQNIGTTNPLSIIKVFSEEQNSRELDANALAQRLNPNYDLRTITPLLNDLVENGFILYDKENELVIVREKTLRYSTAYSAINGKNVYVDYDVIEAISASREVNAKIDLTDNSMELQGVREVVLSDSQLVAYKPYFGEMKIQNNRNIDFDGRLFAGFGIFEGKDFQFNYEEFKIYGNQIDSFILRIPDKTKAPDENNRYPLIPLATKIENMKAEIVIDEPENKSSLVNNQHYPALYSNEPCYVYYDAPKTQDGVYDRDSFFFQVEPFVFDSLDSFDPKDLSFDGGLNSYDIFPGFDETLKVRGDMSLGFTTVTPPEGYDIYKGKGHYKGVISMNNEGLLGEGNFTYLASSINSEDIIFRPKQLVATADSFNLEKFKGDKYEFPKISGEDVRVDWRPYKDSMYVETEEKPFMVFDPTFSLVGRTILTPGGLYGDGILEWPDARMESNNLRFRANGVTADSTDMRIKTEGAKSIAFSTANVKADIDFDKKMGYFESNTNEISTSLPENQYRTSMDEFDWYIEDKVIDFRSKKGKATFLSVHPDQDSLSFNGDNASYNLTTNLLKVEGVPFIQSADAFIYPKEGKVEVEKGARMKTLENATILADTSNRYHTINKAIVTVLGKNNYKAREGFYEYNVGEFEQEVQFNKIDIIKNRKGPNAGRLTTVGQGNVALKDYFYLDKKTFFQGTVKLSADRKELNFDGFARINSKLVSDSSWFSIDNWVDRKNVILTYDEPRNLVGQKLSTGIFIKRDTGLIYQRILTPQYSRRDRPIFQTKGVMKYVEDPAEGLDEFHFGDSSKVLANGLRGNQIIFNRMNGRMDFEGKFTLGDKLPYVKVDAAGEGSMSHDGQNIKLDMVLGLYMPIPDKLLNFVLKDIETNNFSLADATYDKSYVRKGIAEFIPEDKRLAKVYKEIDDYDKIYLPRGTNNYTFFFGNAPMEWNPTRYSLVSKKGITLTYIKDKAIHKQINAYLEVRMSRSRDEVNFYIETPSGDEYYFNFQNRVLSVVSSNPSFNDAILGMKAKELSFKMPDGESYEVKPTGLNAMKFFLNRVKY